VAIAIIYIMPGCSRLEGIKDECATYYTSCKASNDIYDSMY